MDAKAVLKANFEVARRFGMRQVSRFDRVDAAERGKVNAVCRGYSTAFHWRFFRWVMQEHKPASMAIAGVFFGRDVSYLCTLSKMVGDPGMTVTGVDLFADHELPDWSPDQKGSWEANGYGQAPSIENTQKNIDALGFSDRVTLNRGDAIEFFESATESWDFIYIDTSHDYLTTLQTIEAALPRLNPGGIMGGDDYLDFGMWGVRSAVTKALPDHQTFASDFIWWWQKPAKA